MNPFLNRNFEQYYCSSRLTVVDVDAIGPCIRVGAGQGRVTLQPAGG